MCKVCKFIWKVLGKKMLFDEAKILLQDTDFQLIIVNVENSYDSHKTNSFPDTSTSSFLEHMI